MLREMQKLDRRGRRPSGPRTPWRRRPRVRAALAGGLFVALLGGFMLRIVADPTLEVTYAYPDADRQRDTVTHTVEGGGSYAFIATQDGSEDPVTYDPCEPIRLVVNDRTAGEDADEVVDRAVGAVADATGLELVVTGRTDARPGTNDVDSLDADDPPPVLLAWSDPEEAPDLGGDVVGFAGSAWVVDDDGVSRYKTGEVLLDGPALRAGGTDMAAAVLQHELGHLLGLDHVDDTGELMYPYSGERVDWGPGDLAGLQRLGAGTCA